MKRKLALIFIFVCVSIFAIYYIGIPFVLNSNTALNFIQNKIKEETGFNIVLNEPSFKMGYLPSVWIKSKAIKIQDSNATPLFIQNPSIKIALFPLVINKLHILNFSCDKLNADFIFKKDKKLYIGNNPLQMNSNDKTSFDGTKINIKNYKIKLNNEILSRNSAFIGSYFIIDEFNPNNSLNFSINSKVITKNSKALINAKIQIPLPIDKHFSASNFMVDGNIKNLNLDIITPYIFEFTNGNISQLSGIINIQAKTKTLALSNKRFISELEIKNGSAYINKLKNKIILPEKVLITSEADLLNKDLKINKLNISSNGINADVSGFIHALSANTPKLDLKLKLFNSKSEKIISAIPAIKLPDLEIDLVALKKYGLYSDTQADLAIKGNAKKPYIYGDLVFSNAYVYKPLNIPKALIKIEFTGHKLKPDAVVPASPTEKVFVKGNIHIYNKSDVFLDIKSTSNVDLAITEAVLLPLHEILMFDLGPVPVMDIKGKGNIDLKVKGSKIDPHLFGIFNFNNAIVSFNDVHNCQIENGKGTLKFDNTNFYFTTNNATLFSKPIKVEGTCDIDGKLNFYVTALSANLNKLLNILKTSPMLSNFKKDTDVLEATSGDISLKLNLRGVAKDITEFMSGKNISYAGDIKLLGNDIVLKGLSIHFKNFKGNITFKDDDISFDFYPLITKTKRIRVKGRKIGDKIYSKLRLDKLNCSYCGVPVSFTSGFLEIAGDKIILHKINGTSFAKPFFVDGRIENFLSNPKFDIFAASKVKQNFIDKYINRKNIYPLIAKGDISYTAKILGSHNNMDLNIQLKIPEESSIYYYGAIIGDAMHPIQLTLDANVKNKNVIYIKNFQYDKYINSNKRQIVSPQLNVKGIVTPSNNNLYKFTDLKIKSFAPTDARIFNLLFKKIFIKRGTFVSDLIINGSYPNLKILGKLDLDDIDIPFSDTTINDINFYFKDKLVNCNIAGEVFSQEFNIKGNVGNRLTPPYIFNDVVISADKIDLNQITRHINNIEVESTMTKIASKTTQNSVNLDTNDFVIHKMIIKAKTFIIRNITANNLYSNLDLKQSHLKLNNFKFNIADGHVSGDFLYNFKNHETALDLHVNSVNANSIMESFLNLKNQLYGSLDGELSLTCKGTNQKECMKTLNGNCGFRVLNGKMPKLGSLSYLLKAANLVKSGVTGLTINSLIDLVTPLKTGEFKNINGLISIKSGIAKDIQIFSKGKALSIFITGDYNCYDLIADLQIFGRISKKESNVLGVIGNTSLNTLFNVIPGIDLDSISNATIIKSINKIPGIELNDKSYRIFYATVKGNLNSDNYVQSFQWLE